MSKNYQELQTIIASLLFASDQRLSKSDLVDLICKQGNLKPDLADIEQTIAKLEEQFAQLAIDIHQTADGYRLQTNKDYAPWVSLLWQDKTPVYSKALLETLALIAYRQPITRSEIEHIRGVSVSGHIVRTLLDRKWIRIIGHRQVPGKPALYGSTRDFLDYFNLTSLSELPSLPELKSVEELDQAMQRLIDETGSTKPDKKTKDNTSLFH